MPRYFFYPQETGDMRYLINRNHIQQESFNPQESSGNHVN